MKKILLGLLLSAPLIVAMDDKTITLSNQKVLQERLDAIAMTHFAEKTKIVSRLAGQEKHPLGVAMAVDLAIYDYLEDMKKGMPVQMLKMTTIQMDMHKPLIFEALLKDEPKALAELEKLGLYTPTKK